MRIGVWGGLQESAHHTRHQAFGRRVGRSTELSLPPQCPDTLDPRDTCVLNPLREPFAKKECSILLSEVFETCHPVVSGSQAPESPPHLPRIPSVLRSLLPACLRVTALEGRVPSAISLPLACSDESVLSPLMSQDRQTDRASGTLSTLSCSGSSS